jgi:hypothetical protein
MRFVLLAAASAMLAGCASMSKDECLYADWRAIGFEDGAVGASASAISSRRQACAKAGVTPDTVAYLDGREAGLFEYCTPANGFSAGESGAAYSGACARHGEATFLDQYRAGAHLYLLRDRVRTADYALYHAAEDLAEIQKGVAHAAASLVRPDLTVAERAAFVVELTRLSGESDLIERAIPALRTDLEIAEAELAAYRSQLASRPLPLSAQVAVR